MTLPSQRDSRINIYILKPFPEIIRAWLLNSKNFTNIDLTHIDNRAVGLAMEYGLVKGTIDTLKRYGLKDSKDFIVI